MKKLLSFMLIMAFLPSVYAGPKKTVGSGESKKITKKSSLKSKKRQFIDLEALEVQGLIDRPQTLYILKKSETTFKDNIDEYDYMKAIVDSTYKEPF